MNHIIALSILGLGIFVLSRRLRRFERDDLVEKIKDEIDGDSAVREAQHIINSKLKSNNL